MPYSVEEIYGLHSSGKYQNTRKVYQQMYRIYSDKNILPIKPEKIIVEDSNSGYDFFSSVSEDQNLERLTDRAYILNKISTIVWWWA